MAKSFKVRRALNSLLMVTGALLVGNALHEVFVTKAWTLLGPGAVLSTLAGVAMILVGRQIYNPMEEARHRRAQADASGGGDEEFDPEMSPMAAESVEDERED